MGRDMLEHADSRVSGASCQVQGHVVALDLGRHDGSGSGC